jgi:transposase
MNPTPQHWKAARRLQAWRLKQRGWSQRQIAAALSVSEGAASQWVRRVREAGPDALRHRSPPGASRRVSTEQLARLPELLRQGPTADGFRGELWTRSRIAAVIRVCNVMRWSPQKPARRARQRDEVAIAHGRKEIWPALNRGRKSGSTRSSL